MTKLADLIDLEAERLQLGHGYEFTEGPAWSVAEQALIFSDIPADTRYRWTGDGPPGRRGSPARGQRAGRGRPAE